MTTVLRCFIVAAVLTVIVIMLMFVSSIFGVARADTGGSTVVTLVVLPYLSVGLETGEVHSNYPVAATTSYLTIDGIDYRITSVL